MQRQMVLLLALTLAGLSGHGQIKTDNEWVKKPSTSMYSLKYEKKVEEDFYKQNQKKYVSKIDIEKTKNDMNNSDERRRLNAVKNLGLIPENNQISKIEDLLINDPSFTVRMECAKSLKYQKSTKSIPILITQLKTDYIQLKLEIALTLASLGEKTECFKALKELGRTGERNVILDTHLGYLDLATNDAVEKLKMDLSDSNSYVSVDAAIVLAELGYFKEAFPILKSKLSDTDKYIRMAALRGLAYIGNDKSIELIRSMLNDNENLVKERSELILKNCHLN